MTDQEQKELGKILWSIADKLQICAMNADDFRDYMLSFLFLRYLSDNYEQVARQELDEEYPYEHELSSQTTPLQIWYKENEADIVEFEDLMRRRMHYVIKPQYLWSNISGLARKQDEDLLNTLQKGFDFIENESFKSSFGGLFSEINLNSEKLGKNYTTRNKKLCEIIYEISHGLKFSKDKDDLGDAYEYLIGQFAADQVKKLENFIRRNKFLQFYHA